MQRNITINTEESILFILVAIVCLVQACDGFESGKPNYSSPPKATNILDINIQPHPVPIDSPFTLEVIVEDSLNKELEYSWTVTSYGSERADSNSVKFPPADTTGKYGGSVHVYDHKEKTGPASEVFEINVIDTSNN